MADIYLHINDGQHGPYTSEQLELWLRDGTVSPDTPAWREGMPEWKPLSMWGAAAEAMEPSQSASIPQQSQPYYHPPGAGHVPTAVVPGYGRVFYVTCMVLAWVFTVGVVWIATEVVGKAITSRSADDPMRESYLTGLIITCVGAFVIQVVAGIWLGAKRLLNIGWNAVWVLLMFVPAVNLFLGVGLLALPPGFARTQKLDGAAWFMIVVALTFVGMSIMFLATTDFVDNLKTHFESLSALRKPAA